MERNLLGSVRAEESRTPEESHQRNLRGPLACSLRTTKRSSVGTPSNAKVGQILQGPLRDFKFSMASLRRKVNHGPRPRLPWHLGPERAAPVVTGMDIAVLRARGESGLSTHFNIDKSSERLTRRAWMPNSSGDLPAPKPPPGQFLGQCGP